jgi:hypothetical protein
MRGGTGSDMVTKDLTVDTHTAPAMGPNEEEAPA